MNFTKNLLTKHSLSLLFFLIFILLGQLYSRLFTYLDDPYFYWPVIHGNMDSYFIQYMKDYGVFRPLTLLYYFGIFSVYRFSSVIAHLIPLGLFLVSNILLFRILRLSGMGITLAFAIFLLVSFFPPAVEMVGWLSANSAVIVYFFLLLQIYIILVYSKKNWSLWVVAGLQWLSIGVYETTAFFPLALLFLYAVQSYGGKRITRKEVGNLFIWLGILFVPLLVYVFLRSLIIPVVDSRSRFLFISEIFSHWKSFFNQAVLTIQTPGLGMFLLDSLKRSIQVIMNSFWFGGLSVGVGVGLYSLFTTAEEKNQYHKKFWHSLFWFIAGCTSLLPLSWQNNYLSFRLLFLPSVCFLLSCMFLIRSWFEKYVAMIVCVLAGLGLLFQIEMAQSYRQQYLHDTRMSQELAEIVEVLGYKTTDWATFLIINMPNNTLDSYIYGDYLFSAFTNFWTAEYFYRIHSGEWKNIAVEMSYNKELRSRFSKQEILERRPLVVITFTNQYECRQGNCFELVSSQ